MVEVRPIITLANSIIGVSILAMPFCFKQCGIVLAILMLYLSGLLVKSTSYFLLKSAVMARRNNYEDLAQNVFGAPGKMAVEMGMIGFLFGTCIAFFVVIGDLAPPILSNIIGVENNYKLRFVILVGMASFVVLPLSLLRNVSSLVALCAASIIFYGFVMCFVMFSSLGSLFHTNWWNETVKWRPAGIFQCLPIFCMALSCQPQLFEVYDVLPDPSLSRMVQVVKGAVNLCSGVYISVGFFGYVAFFSTDFGGNILTVFDPSLAVEMCKFGFVLSVAVSFPLVIFPCRTSIYSLVFRKGQGEVAGSTYNIPYNKFVLITVCVVAASCVVAVRVPDIELVLGIVGSTIGTVVCILFPVSMFIRLVNANTTERLFAQAIFVVGIIVLVLGTYVTLYEADAKTSRPEAEAEASALPHFHNPPPIADPRPPEPVKDVVKDVEPVKIVTKDQEVRKEPVEPVAPDDSPPAGQKDGKKPEAKKDEKEKVVKRKKDEEAKAERKAKVKEIKEKEKELEKKEEKADKLIEELAKQKAEQEQLLEQQKEVLEAMKLHVEEEKQKRPVQQPVLENLQPRAAPKQDNRSVQQGASAYVPVQNNLPLHLNNPPKIQDERGDQGNQRQGEVREANEQAFVGDGDQNKGNQQLVQQSNQDNGEFVQRLDPVPPFNPNLVPNGPKIQPSQKILNYVTKEQNGQQNIPNSPKPNNPQQNSIVAPDANKGQNEQQSNNKPKQTVGPNIKQELAKPQSLGSRPDFSNDNPSQAVKKELKKNNLKSGSYPKGETPKESMEPNVGRDLKEFVG